MRILIVGPTARYKRTQSRWYSKRDGLMFYSFAHRLANGFVRNGHFVMMLNDRDARDQTLDLPMAGEWLANRRLLRLARELQPDLLCLQHSDLIRPETVSQIRETMPHCRVAVVYYDSVFAEKSAARFRNFLEVADFGFATTGGATLSRFADTCPVAFIPNPVDLSIDNLRAYAVAHKPVDVFFACCASSLTERWALVDELCRLNPHLQYALHGRDKMDRISGNAYYTAIDQAKVGLNLNSEEGDLYSSDRMAQYLGNGLLLATRRASGYERYFGEDEMIFFDDAAELSHKLNRVVFSDHRWRDMAQKARAKAVQTMAGELVTDFIIRMTMGSAAPEGWQFSDHIYGAPAFVRLRAADVLRSAAGRVAAA